MRINVSQCGKDAYTIYFSDNIKKDKKIGVIYIGPKQKSLSYIEDFSTSISVKKTDQVNF